MTDQALGATEVLDAHVHFWDPQLLEYPWLGAVPALGRSFLAADYAAATAHSPVDAVILVEANCLPDQTVPEVQLFERSAADCHVAAIVAYASLTTPRTLDRTLDELSAVNRVTGIRHNIQGEAPGFCTQSVFVDGVQKVGRRGLTFDLCATHEQLPDIIALVKMCPDTRFILDHGGKPAIRDALLDPWRSDIGRLAECANVWCKLSGLTTEADHASWREADLVPYVSHVVERFGTSRVIYGSDWPVLTLAGTYSDWWRFTTIFTQSWSDDERRGFYGENAKRVYGI